MIGTTISHYRISAKLGEGGMGVVYRARDERLDRDVAIKVLPEAVARDRGRLARFEREAKAVAKLSHPNILEIFDFGSEGEVTFAVTELLEGETLGKLLERGPLGWRKAAETGAAIADGLAAAHRSGIVHRDLKPSNIFLTSDVRVKILDFGLARTVEMPGAGAGTSPTVSEYTRPGLVLGTAGYMSPEQVRGEPADPRSDVFSLGCVLYEMITGRRAFVRDTAAETMTAILKEDPSDLLRHAPNGPPVLASAVQRCLEKRPEARFQSAGDLAYALRSVVQDDSGLLVHHAPSDKKSILVLPFTNLSPDPEQEYFCDGVTEEITADLSQLHGLRVISRNSALRMKEVQKDILTIGRELGVRYVLEGSVRKVGNRLRITAQLIDAPSNEQLWAGKYDGTLDDVFDIQESVSRSIVDALKLRLSPQEDRRLGDAPIQDLRAHECYLRARHEMWMATEASLDRALALVERGLEFVENNEPLLAMKGWICGQYVNNLMKAPDTYGQLLEESRRCAETCLSLNPHSAHGHGLLASFHLQSGNPGGAIRHWKRALESLPNFADPLLALGYCRAAGGFDRAGARELIERAMEIDPFSPVARSAPGWLHWLSGNFRGAIDCFRAVRDLERSPLYSLWLAWLHAADGDPDEAHQLVDRMIRDMPGHVMADLASFLMHAWRGERERALGAVSGQLEQGARWDDLFSLCMADGYALISEHNPALRWLEHTINYGLSNVSFLSRHDPFLASLRTDERFEALLDKARRLSETLGGIS